MRYIDIKNKIFGNLRVEKYIGNTIQGRLSLWECNCNCGNKTIVTGNNLRMGRTKSCGCGSVNGLRLGWEFWKGKKRPEISGEKNPSWKGGVTPKNSAARKTLEYRLWREAVFKRDNYTCIWCGQIGGKLNADHIKPFCAYEESRLDIDNGRTLCVDCHRKTDTWGEGAKKFKFSAGLLA